MKQFEYDVIIIGAGQAGIPLGYALADADLKTAIVERAKLGGSCVNFGCTPTKAAIASARTAHLARRGAEFGLKIPHVEVDFPAVLKRAREIAAESRESLEKGLNEVKNPAWIKGHARLTGKNDAGFFELKINNQVYAAKQIVLNTGTRSVIPKIEGLDAIEFIDAGNWLEKTDLPQHLAILGGSYIGLEMSQFYRRMGSRVTVIDSNPHIASREDTDVSDALREVLEKEGIEFRLESKITRIESGAAGAINLTLDRGGKPDALTASHLFIATGRQPNTDDLGLETIGVKTDEHGIIEVDETLATGIAGIWAAGDVRGGGQFTHTAWDDYRILESQMIGDKTRTTKRIVPYAMFTDPELGRVGITEKEAREKGLKIKMSVYEMNKNGKAREIGEPTGFIKIIADAETDKILGAAVLANEGAELVHLYVDLMNADAPFTVLKNAVHIHPTLAEAVQSAVKPL